jgi:hypothetical protein
MGTVEIAEIADPGPIVLFSFFFLNLFTLRQKAREEEKKDER